MNNELRKIYTNCRLYGKIIFRTGFHTKNGFLLFIDILFTKFDKLLLIFLRPYII